MTPVPHPQTRLAYSAEPQPAHRSEFRARKQHTLFLIHAIGLAHLGSIGVEVERIILRDRRVAWRAPLSVQPERASTRTRSARSIIPFPESR